MKKPTKSQRIQVSDYNFVIMQYDLLLKILIIIIIFLFAVHGETLGEDVTGIY